VDTSFLPGESSFEEIMSSAVNLLANLSDRGQFFFLGCELKEIRDMKRQYQEICMRWLRF
jgi:hypothetical protein